MKKKLVFVMESLEIGGAEKSLVTLLSQLDYSKYEVDLFLFRQCGEFLELLPKEVKVLEVSEDFRDFMLSPKKSIVALIKRKKIRLMSLKFIELMNIMFNKYILKKEYIGWDLISKCINSINDQYDTAIGFLEKKSIYFVADKINSKYKIGWIHTDYSKVEHNYKLDCKKFNKIDTIVTVSEHCREAFIKEFPHMESSVEVIRNIISPKIINKLANEKVIDLNLNNNELMICTVGRLTEAKGIDIAIDCCRMLLDNNKNFKWIVIGDGEEYSRLQSKIEKKGVKDNFILIGSKANPYPYMKKCDIYVQPSKWEGFGITVAEAKVLKKPIVVSDIPEFREQIENNKNGLIYNDIKDMVNKIERLMIDKEYREKLSHNIHIIKNYEEINKVEKLFN